MDYYNTMSENYNKQQEINLTQDIVSKIIDNGYKTQMNAYRTGYYQSYQSWYDFVVRMLKIGNNRYSNEILLNYLQRSNIILNNNLDVSNKIADDMDFFNKARYMLLNNLWGALCD